MFPELTRDDVFRIETARLWLRWPRASDVAAIVPLAGDAAIAEMTARIPHPFATEDANGFVLRSRRANMEGEALTMAVTLRGRPDAAIGIVAIEPHGAEDAPQLGYWLGTPYWGDGLMTEAAQAMIDAYFAYAGGQELISTVRVVNPGSRRVLEKCGFSHVGVEPMAFPARNAVFPVDRFRLDRATWSGSRGWPGTAFLPSAGQGEAVHA